MCEVKTASYTGELNSNGQKHGEGVYLVKSGDRPYEYKGCFVLGEKAGWGNVTSKNSLTYCLNVLGI